MMTNNNFNPVTAYTVMMFVGNAGSVHSERINRYVGTLDSIEYAEAYYEQHNEPVVVYVLEFNSENLMLTSRKFTYPQKGLL
jgi:hypothetical protein